LQIHEKPNSLENKGVRFSCLPLLVYQNPSQSNTNVGILLVIWYFENANTNTRDANMKLTDLFLKNLKPTGKVQKYADGGSLYILVSPTGGRLWRMAYRFYGKQKTLTFGPYMKLLQKYSTFLGYCPTGS
jgi:hypothetical protein